MKKYEALQTFHGAISLKKGEYKMLDPQYFIVKDLERAGLICEVKPKKTAKQAVKKEVDTEDVEAEKDAEIED